MDTDRPASERVERSWYRIAIAATPLLLVFFHWNWLVLGRPVLDTDTPFFFPLHEEFRRWIARGQSPWWTDSIFCGYPIGPESNAIVLNPFLHFLLRWAGSRAEGFWFYAHSLIAAFSMLACCRRMGCSRPASVLAAWAFALGGIFTNWLHWPNLFAQAAWFPLQLLCVEALMREGNRLGWTAALACASAAQWLAGPHATVLAPYFCLLYALLRLLLAGESGDRGHGWAGLFWTGAGVALGVALAAYQVLPMLEVLKESERASGVTLGFASRGALPPWGMLLPIFPALYGAERLPPGLLPPLEVGAHWWGPNIYPGALATLLALTAVGRWKEKPLIRVHAVVFGVCFLFALGKWSPVFPLLRHFPGLGQMRAPGRALVPAAVCLCILAAMGFDLLAARGRQALPAWRRISVVMLGILVGVWLLAGVIVRAAEAPLHRAALKEFENSEIRRLAQEGISDPASKEERQRLATRRADSLVGQIHKATSPFSVPSVTNLGFVALAALVLGFWLARAGGSRRWWGALAAVCVLDLFWFHWTWGSLPGPPDSLRPPSYIKQIDSSLRVFSLVWPGETNGLSWDHQRQWLPADMNTAWRLDSPDGHASLNPVEYEQTLFEPLRGKLLAGSERLRRVAGHEGRLRFLGVGSVIAPADWGRLPWPVLYEDGFVRVWKVREPFPREFVSTLPDLDTARWGSALRVEEEDPGVGELFGRLAASMTGVVRRLPQVSPDWADFDIELDREGFFIRTTRWTPGWTATVDGQATPLVKVFAFFQGIRLGPGRHTVHLEYRPKLFRVGVWLSAAASFGIVLLVVGAGLSARRSADRRPPRQPANSAGTSEA